MQRPHLSDTLYHAKVLRKLADQWPTFSYFSARSKCTALKESPIHLADYMDFSAKDDFCQQIIEEAEWQQGEEKAVEVLLDQVTKGREAIMSSSPFATALTCHFYRGSAWLNKSQNEILKTILQSPTAAHLALCSGYFQGDITALLNKISENPLLTLDVSQNTALRAMVDEKWFLTALEPHPVHHAIDLFLKGQSKQALERLHLAAVSDAVCAGVCLGLQPEGKKADDWLVVANGCPEAYYMMGRVWKAGRNDISTHPHRITAYAEIRRDPRWHYLWLRDVASEVALQCLPEIWPSPWAVELILDLELPVGWVLGMTGEETLDPKKALDSAVILWAAEQTLSSS